MSLDSLLADTVTYRRQTGVGTDGEPSYGSASTVKARVQVGRDRTPTTIDHTHVLYTAVELKVDDKVWLPGDDTNDDTVARRARSVAKSTTPGGDVTVWKVLL